MQSTIIAITCSAVMCAAASADAEDSRSEWVLREKAKVSGEQVNAASDASFDKRLPPVLPGEEVNDSGKRVKVWSSSGPVPVNEAPVAKRRHDADRSLGEVGVVIDGREPAREPKLKGSDGREP